MSGVYPGKGMRFQLYLPLTLRFAHVAGGDRWRALRHSLLRSTAHAQAAQNRIETVAGRHHFMLETNGSGCSPLIRCLITANRNGSKTSAAGGSGDLPARYGLVVDSPAGRTLNWSSKPLDSRLGRIKRYQRRGVDGRHLFPLVLIVDVDEHVLRTWKKLTTVGLLERRNPANKTARRRRRVLAVDDSLTVRELERKSTHLAMVYLADVA